MVNHIALLAHREVFRSGQKRIYKTNKTLWISSRLSLGRKVFPRRCGVVNLL